MLVASLPIAFKTGKPQGLHFNCKDFQIQRATLSTKEALGNNTKVTFFFFCQLALQYHAKPTYDIKLLGNLRSGAKLSSNRCVMH